MVKRLGIIVFVVISVMALSYASQITNQRIIDSVENIKGSSYCLPAFIAWSILICFLNFPLGVITKLLSGWLFGFFHGFFIVYFSTAFGSFLAFRLSRYLGKELMENYFKRSITKLNDVLMYGKLAPLIQIRIFPFIPLPVANLCLGVTKVSDVDFALSTFVGILPASVFYTYLGSQLVALSSQPRDFNSLLPYYIYILAALLVSFSIPYFYKKTKKKEPPFI